MDTLFSFRYMRIIVAIFGVMVIALVGASAAHMLNLIQTDYNYPTISVEGKAEISAVPDVGVFTFTVEAEGVDVAEAQELSGNKMNDIMTYLKSEGGVEEKDIKTTGYNAYPRYEYRSTDCTFSRCDQERELVAYVVTQTVRVKVRDTSAAGTLVGAVGGRGATNISGLTFEIDDMEALREEARLAAIADAKDKAKARAKELDVRLGDIVSFNDGGFGGYPQPFETRAMMAEMAFDEVAVSNFAPEIAVGEDAISASVNITYELK